MSRRSRALGTYGNYNPKSKLKTKVISFFRIILLLFIVYQLLVFFILSPFTLGTSAMEPEILKNQKLLSTPILTGNYLKLLNLRIPGIKAPERGDIVIIRSGNREIIPWYILILDSAVRFFTLQKKTLLSASSKPWNNQIAVKRIIGVPGDTVKLLNYHFFIKDENGTDFLPEEKISHKKYEIRIPSDLSVLDASIPFSGNMEEITLQQNNYFVANDNRQMQYDSRFYGPVNTDNIMGKVILSYWPGFSIK